MALISTFRPSEPVAQSPPNDPLFPTQWNLPLVQIPDAWAVSNGADAVVAVLDTGVAFEDHNEGGHSFRKPPGFARTKFVPGYDFVDDDEHPNDNVDPSAPHEPAHGTHKAAVIAETTNEGRGAASVAPGAAVMPVRVLDWRGNGEPDDIAAGIKFAADRGADIAVMSLTGGYDPLVAEAVKYAAGKGLIMVAPSGNSGAGEVAYPASDPNVISVGAVGADKSRAYYSSYGTGLDLVAPGGDLTVDLNRDGLRDGIRQQTFVQRPDGFCHCEVEGTSAAAPHVAAIAALLVASGRATTPSQIRHALVSSALDLGPPGHDPFYGAGLVQASGALALALTASADLSLNFADARARAPRGTVVTSTFTVRNAGPAAATDVVLTETLHAAVAVESVTTSQGSCTIADTTPTCVLGTVPVGTAVTVTVVVTVMTDQALTHSAAVRAEQADPNAANNTVPAGDHEQGETSTSSSHPAGHDAGRRATEPTALRRAAAVVLAVAGLALLAGFARNRRTGRSGSRR